MEVVAGDIARVAIGDVARGMAKVSQIDWPAAAFADGALDLVAAVAAPQTQSSGKTTAVDDIAEVSQSDVAPEADQ